MKEKTIYNPYQELANAIVLGAARDSVSYTHLTLPTILLV